MLELIIKNGLFFDGLGTPPRRCDMGIQDGKVAALAPCLSQPAREVRDASDLWITPGFVDIHTHYDLEVEMAPGLQESVQHGVTTVIMGNCSLSITLGDPTTLANMFQRVETLPTVLLHKWMQTAVAWHTPQEYVDHLRTLPLGPNVAAFLGHSALRAHVMGLERSLHAHADTAELTAMRRLARAALEAGCIGISLDMLPWHRMSGVFCGRPLPSHHASWQEYQMLAELCREYDAVVQVTPNPQNLWSLVAIIRMGQGLTHRPLRLTVLSALDAVVDRRLWRVFAPLLFFCNTLLRGNVRFQTIPEPFTIYADGPITPLFEEFPSGVQLNNCPSRQARQELWSTPGFRDQFRREWLAGWRKTFHRDLECMDIVRCPDSRLVGTSFAVWAQGLGRDVVDVFMDLLTQYDTDLRWVATGANDRLAPRLALLRQPYILPGFSDAGAHVQNLGYYDGAISLLKQAVTTGFLTPEQAVARVTGEPAHWFRLNTGVLRLGAKADFLLLRPEALRAPLSPQVAIHDPLLDGATRMVKRGSQQLLEAVYIGGTPVLQQGQVLETLGREPCGTVLTLSATSRTQSMIRSIARHCINAKIVDHPFTDYWDVFVLKHQNPYNIALHVLGVLIFYGLLLGARLLHTPWLLWCLPLSQFVGLLGHYSFERSHIDWRDAVFSWRASRCLNKMFYRVMTGQYGDDMRRALAALQTYQQSGQAVSTAPEHNVEA